MTLPCQAGKDRIITVLAWTRADLGADDYVFLYHDGHFSNIQHSLFKNRVALKDKDIRDGDVTIILKHVTTNDTGVYKCVVFSRNGMGKAEPETIKVINLSVFDPPGE